MSALMARLVDSSPHTAARRNEASMIDHRWRSTNAAYARIRWLGSDMGAAEGSLFEAEKSSYITARHSCTWIRGRNRVWCCL